MIQNVSLEMYGLPVFVKLQYLYAIYGVHMLFNYVTNSDSHSI